MWVNYSELLSLKSSRGISKCCLWLYTVLLVLKFILWMWCTVLICTVSHMHKCWLVLCFRDSFLLGVAWPCYLAVVHTTCCIWACNILTCRELSASCLMTVVVRWSPFFLTIYHECCACLPLHIAVVATNNFCLHSAWRFWMYSKTSL